MRVSNPDAIPDCQRKSQARFCNARKRSPKRDRCAVVSFSMNASRWRPFRKTHQRRALWLWRLSQNSQFEIFPSLRKSEKSGFGRIGLICWLNAVAVGQSGRKNTLKWAIRFSSTEILKPIAGRGNVRPGVELCLWGRQPTSARGRVLTVAAARQRSVGTYPAP